MMPQACAVQVPSLSGMIIMEPDLATCWWASWSARGCGWAGTSRRAWRYRKSGNWLSLVTVNLGAVLIWASIFLLDLRSPLHASGYVLFGVSLVAAAWETGAIALALRRAESWRSRQSRKPRINCSAA